MKRRAVLAAIGSTSLLTSGCLQMLDRDKTTTEENKESRDTSTTEEDSDREDSTTSTFEGSTKIKIESSVEEELTIELTIHREEESIHTESIDVPPSHSVFAEYEIMETGMYEIVIETDTEREGGAQVHVDEYALNHSNDIVIAITSQIIRG